MGLITASDQLNRGKPSLGYVKLQCRQCECIYMSALSLLICPDLFFIKSHWIVGLWDLKREKTYVITVIRDVFVLA